jgi:hypothetical protein
MTRSSPAGIAPGGAAEAFDGNAQRTAAAAGGEDLDGCTGLTWGLALSTFSPDHWL